VSPLAGGCTVCGAMPPAHRLDCPHRGTGIDPTATGVTVTHTVSADVLSEHGEDAVLAWVRQSLRELAQHHPAPLAETYLTLKTNPDGSVTIVTRARLKLGRAT